MRYDMRTSREVNWTLIMVDQLLVARNSWEYLTATAMSARVRSLVLNNRSRSAYTEL